jgi:hypothetical protein
MEEERCRVAYLQLRVAEELSELQRKASKIDDSVD